MNTDKITISEEEMALVFTEWNRRYAENPEEFGELLDADGNAIEDYGEEAAAYFLKIASETLPAKKGEKS